MDSMEMGARPAPASQQTHDDASGAAWAGAVVVGGVILYVILTGVAQTLPPHYSPIAQAESDLAVDLAVGPYGWLMTIVFVLRGLIAIALVVGLWRDLAPQARSTWGLALLVVWAAGDILLAIFPTDAPPARPTFHGVIHLVVAFAIFIAVALGEFRVAQCLPADPRWAPLSPWLLAIAVASLVALLAFFLAGTASGLFGLFERLFLGLTLLWMLVAGIQLIRLQRR